MDAMSQDKDKDQFYSPPPNLSKSERIMKFVWNPETGQFMGRTATSWAKILLFYLIFYLVLAAFWTGLWVVFTSTSLRQDKPKFMLKESLIGTNPGLGYRPMPPEEYIESALIWFKQSNYAFVNWTIQLDNFLRPYKKTYTDQSENRNLYNCSYDHPVPSGKICRVPFERMTPCTGQFYNYDNGSPCIFLKLNKIFNWIPDYYNDTDNLPTGMPTDLKTKIRAISDRNRRELNTVWVSCDGENAADKEHIGAIQLHPSPGFPGFYFPFSNAEGYLSPLVAVWFEKPVRGVLINIECRAWAKNIIYDRHDRRGSVHFELMID